MRDTEAGACAFVTGTGINFTHHRAKARSYAARMEQIAGPVHGFHLACYTVSTDDGFYGYAKICATRPQCVWHASTAVRKLAAGPYPLAKDAMQAIIAATERKLADRAQSLSRRT